MPQLVSSSQDVDATITPLLEQLHWLRVPVHTGCTRLSWYFVHAHNIHNCKKFHRVDTKSILITLNNQNNILFIDVSTLHRKPSSGLTSDTHCRYGTRFYILTTGTGSQSWWRLPMRSQNVDNKVCYLSCLEWSVLYNIWYIKLFSLITMKCGSTMHVFWVEENISSVTAWFSRCKGHFKHAVADLKDFILNISTVRWSDADLHVAFASLSNTHCRSQVTSKPPSSAGMFCRVTGHKPPDKPLGQNPAVHHRYDQTPQT